MLNHTDIMAHLLVLIITPCLLRLFPKVLFLIIPHQFYPFLENSLLMVSEIFLHLISPV
jgi:hypothetical protein